MYIKWCGVESENLVLETSQVESSRWAMRKDGAQTNLLS
jgi:hypothetical protein